VTERIPEGTLYETPFPRVLFRLWKKEASGRLVIRREEKERALHFSKGRLIVDRDGLSETDFLKALVKKRVLAAEAAKRCEKEAAARSVSLVRTLTELGLVSPLPLWNLIQSYYVRQLFSLFDAEEGRFAFETGAEIPDGAGLGEVDTLDLILQGVRQIQNPGFLERRIPADDEPVYLSLPYFLHRLTLEPHERYVLGRLSGASRLRGFYERSELGELESRKVLFAFLCLDILHGPEPSGPARSSPEIGPDEQARVLTALNEKCAFVYRFITKQIGPLARTILGNALEEIKPALGPVFRKMRLQGDGRIEVDPAMTATAAHLDEDLFRQIIRGYDEVLMAEVLAVKKALGPAYEKTLVKQLGRVGCL
jgi:hypothetical protein